MLTRLDKLIAASGRFSRSEAREAIRAGRVTADGAVLTRPEEKVDEGALIAVDGDALRTDALRCFMLDKPAGILTAARDARQPTVLDLVPEEYRRLGLQPVGRLDKDTTGLLLLTNDGALAHRVISPKSGVVKTYLATTDGDTDGSDAAAFAAGLTLADGTRCLSAALETLGGGQCLVRVQEGKYHQVKRMLAARGRRVLELRRLAIGALELDPALGPGKMRELSSNEIELIFALSHSL